MVTNMIVTAYCACTLCCGPGAPKPTASGAWPQEGVTIAAPRSVPFGTEVKIYFEPGSTWDKKFGARTFKVQDRLAPKYDNRIDIFMRSHEEALKFGKQKLKVDIRTVH